MIAIVCEVNEIIEHPNADRLEILQLCWPDPKFAAKFTEIVTGCHYRVGQYGVYVPPGHKIPGYLAEDAWLVARGKSYDWYEVVSKNMRGIHSPGLFFGRFYEKDTRHKHVVGDLRAEERANLQKAMPHDDVTDTTPLATPVYEWRYWRDHWKLGEDVSAYLGIT